MDDGTCERASAPSARVMHARDVASRVAGIELVEVATGTAVVRMAIRADMLNGHGTCHGGYVFLLADAAFALACNSHGPVTVASGATIEYIRAVPEGEELTASATERRRGKTSGVYDIDVTDRAGNLVAVFRGRSHEITTDGGG